MSNNYRVRILIYDGVDSTIEDPFVVTDEPLYEGSPAEEMATQAHRTYRHHINKLASEQ
jgi:hypothetical protein